jgi:hypothetical protein
MVGFRSSSGSWPGSVVEAAATPLNGLNTRFIIDGVLP